MQPHFVLPRLAAGTSRATGAGEIIPRTGSAPRGEASGGNDDDTKRAPRYQEGSQKIGSGSETRQAD